MHACYCQLFPKEGNRKLPKRLNCWFSVLASATEWSIGKIAYTYVDTSSWYIPLNTVWYELVVMWNNPRCNSSTASVYPACHLFCNYLLTEQEASQSCTSSSEVWCLIALRMCNWETQNASQRIARGLLNLLWTTQSSSVALLSIQISRESVRLNPWCIYASFARTHMQLLESYMLLVTKGLHIA